MFLYNILYYHSTFVKTKKNNCNNITATLLLINSGCYFDFTNFPPLSFSCRIQSSILFNHHVPFMSVVCDKCSDFSCLSWQRSDICRMSVNLCFSNIFLTTRLGLGMELGKGERPKSLSAILIIFHHFSITM